MNEDCAHVRFNEWDRFVKGKRQYGAGRVIPDAGKTREEFHIRAKPSAVLLCNNFTDLLERCCPPVISQALPGSEQIAQRRIRQRSEVWKPVYKNGIFFEHALHLCLLQHDLGYEYAVWVARASPWQFPPMLAVML